MKITRNEKININSISTRHRVLLQATNLLVGREGALETEKELFLMLAMTDAVAVEDIIAACNEAKESLNEILEKDIEPFFMSQMEDSDFVEAFYDLKRILINHCNKIWDNQHSLIGVADAILTNIAAMPEEEREKTIEGAKEAAKEVYEKRTEVLSTKADEINDKLADLMKQYKVKVTENNKDSE